jgi:hypothetical protein
VPRLLVGILVALVLLAALVAGWSASRWLTPESLRGVVEQRLAELTGAPVEIGRLEVALGVGIQLQGDDVRLWPHPDGPGLRVEHVAAGIEPLSLLTGKLQLRRMLLRGAELRIVHGADGRFRAPFGFLDPGEPRPSPHPEELLKPLIAFEYALRFLLARPYLAGALEVEDSRVHWYSPGGRKGPAFSLAIKKGALHHRRLRGDAVLTLEGRLSDSRATLGGMRWTGLRERGGELQVGVELAEVDLAALAPYARALQPSASLAGHAAGTLAFRTDEVGYGRLELDLSFDALEAGVSDGSPWSPLRADHLDAEARLEITAESVGLETARIASGDLELEVAGTIERPLRPSSGAGLELRFRDLDIGEIRALLDWLPHTGAEDLETFVAPVESGRLRTFTARGRAVLSDWEEFFAGRRPIVGMGIGAEADFNDVVLVVGDGDRLEGLGGQVSWSADRVEVRAARGVFNGERLPGLDLAFDGVRHLLEVDPELRRLHGGASPLPGLDALWRIASGGETGDDEAPPLEVELRIDRLDHPVFLWPLRDLRVVARTGRDGLGLDVEEGRWAGVPIRGTSDWIFEPEPRARISLQAEAPEPEAVPAASGPDWAQGSFRVARVDHPRWRQRGAAGRFSARGGWVRVADLEVELEPTGHLAGSASLDLSRPDAVPFGVSLSVVGGDLDALIEQLVPGSEVARGGVDAWCSFEGTLFPDRPFFSDFSGLLEIAAVDGQIQRSLPPLVAIALASESLNPFAERDTIRFRSAQTLLRFGEGRLASDALTIDGPDLRLEASGQVQLLDEANEIEAEVALFLFRQLDRAVGSIPVINLLLLGRNQNLLAAYLQMDGPWREPRSRLVPLKSLAAAGPASLVLEGVPTIVQRGVRALESMMDGGRKTPAPPATRREPEAAPWQKTPSDS